MQLNFIGCVLWFVYLWKSLCNLFDARVLTVCYVFVFMEIEYLVFESLVFIQINAVSVLFHFVFVFFFKKLFEFSFLQQRSRRAFINPNEKVCDSK